MSNRVIRVGILNSPREIIIRADHESLDWLLNDYRTGKSRVIDAHPHLIARAHVTYMLDATMDD